MNGAFGLKTNQRKTRTLLKKTALKNKNEITISIIVLKAEPFRNCSLSFGIKG